MTLLINIAKLRAIYNKMNFFNKKEINYNKKISNQNKKMKILERKVLFNLIINRNKFNKFNNKLIKLIYLSLRNNI